MWGIVPEPAMPRVQQFQRYVQSGAWQCPKGGAHRWVEVETASGIYRCSKCHQAREFPIGDYSRVCRLDFGLGFSLERELSF